MSNSNPFVPPHQAVTPTIVQMGCKKFVSNIAPHLLFVNRAMLHQGRLQSTV
jgi:ABC-type transporter lipoprotein component MlaA